MTGTQGLPRRRQSLLKRRALVLFLVSCSGCYLLNLGSQIPKPACLHSNARYVSECARVCSSGPSAGLRALMVLPFVAAWIEDVCIHACMYMDVYVLKCASKCHRNGPWAFWTASSSINLRRHPLIGIVTTLNGRQTFRASSTCCQGVRCVQEE